MAINHDESYTYISQILSKLYQNGVKGIKLLNDDSLLDSAQNKIYPDYLRRHKDFELPHTI